MVEPWTAQQRTTVAHVGLLGEQPGGMAQVVNGYLAWRAGDVDQVGIRSTRRKHDPAAPLLAAGAALRIVALAARARRSGAPTVAVFHVSEGGSFLREGGLLRLSARLGLRTIAHVHGADFDDFAARRPEIVRPVLRAASAVAVLTDRSAATVRDLVGDSTAVAVVRNSVPSATPAEPKRREVLFGGELGTRKGVDVLLAAWQRISAATPEWRLRLAGPLAPGFVLPDPLPAGVEVLGAVAHDDLLGHLARAAVAVLPSRQEALPMFLLEALAARCAVIGSSAGQVPALLADGAGVVVDAGDTAALEAALRDVLADDGFRAGLVAHGTDRFESTYSTASARPALERFWREVAGA
ncbi:glycosyltransferase family 4 protein [Amnibacterium kyonggiense]